MKRILTLIALLALTSCSPAEPPPTATPPRKTTPPPAPPQDPPSPPPMIPPAAPPPVVPSSEPAPAKSRTVRRPDVPPPGVPRASGISGDIHLPAFTFRSVVGGGQIQINGEFLGATPCLWSVTNGLAFDPKIRVETWPPEGAVKVGTTSHPENGSAEVWLDQSQNLAVRFPHLRRGEAVLYVDGKLGDKEVRGALRLFVEGYKNVAYTPLVNPEGEEASRYLRSIWFDRIQNE